MNSDLRRIDFIDLNTGTVTETKYVREDEVKDFISNVPGSQMISIGGISAKGLDDNE